MVQSPKKNANEVLAQLIKLLSARVTRQSVDNELECHPHYPSFLALSDVLDTWGIANLACKVDADELHTLPCPFVAHLSSGDHVLVVAIDQQKVKVYNEVWSNHELSNEELKLRYEGTVLLAKADEDSGEPAYTYKHRRELVTKYRLPFELTGLSILLVAAFFYFFSRVSFEWPMFILMALKVLGLTTSGILLVQAADKDHPLIQKICSSTKTDCNAILSSSAANIIAELSWSEVGALYFTFTFLLLLLNTGSSAALQGVAILNLLALPYTFYSIYYQWRIAKQWCVLCCTVQVLLWLEVTVLYPYLLGPLQIPGITEIAGVFIAALVPVLIWVFVKSLIFQNKELAIVKQQLRSLKYNFELFNKLLHDQPEHILLDKNESILFNKPGAKYTITMVSNPFCDPCSKAHLKLNEWLDRKPDVQLQIVMYTSANDEDPKAKVAWHMMALYAAKDDKIAKQALDEWHRLPFKNYEQWSKTYPLQETIDFAALEKQKQWCVSAKVDATPAFFINGHKLPHPYKIDDMRYLL